MANVYLKRGVWYVQFRDGAGFRKQVRTTATTKAEAKRIGLELDRTAERQRLGLDHVPADCRLSLAELCEWWLENRCKPDQQSLERGRLRPHILEAPVGKVPVKLLTADHIEDALRAMERRKLAPATINRVRTTLHTIFARAPKAMWSGPNPIKEVRRRAIPKKIRATLAAKEVPLLLAHVPVDWRNLFAAALYTGLRKGELFGLRKSDVDLRHRVIVVAHSYDRDTTKGGHADVIPISVPLLPYLIEALDSSSSDYVFPAPDGSMRSKEADPQKVLRHALARAGLVEAYEHICRRCKANDRAGHTRRFSDDAIRRCEACGMRCWPRAVPRAMRFHDLRHSTATLLLRAGVDLHRVQRILRHKDVKLTVGTYGHLLVDDLRAAVDALPSGQIVDAQFTAQSNLTTRRLPGGNPTLSAKKEAPETLKDLRRLSVWAQQVSNLRPLPCEGSALPLSYAPGCEGPGNCHRPPRLSIENTATAAGSPAAHPARAGAA
jgi:integrase